MITRKDLAIYNMVRSFPADYESKKGKTQLNRLIPAVYITPEDVMESRLINMVVIADELFGAVSPVGLNGVESVWRTPVSGGGLIVRLDKGRAVIVYSDGIGNWYIQGTKDGKPVRTVRVDYVGMLKEHYQHTVEWLYENQ